jgi:hypothetical protein
MKRSSFRKQWVKPERKLPAVPETPPAPRARMFAANDAVVAVPKDRRELMPGDEARLWNHVRSLPCARCWREGNTEVSHSNQLIDGKGRGLKSYPWRIAALCHECHAMIDQGKEFTKAERIAAWESAHRWTVGELFVRGLVRPV